MSVFEKLTAIANAIREKNGTTGKLSLDAMAAAIKAISTGIDTSDANATADQIELGYSAYAKGKKVDGAFTIASELTQQDTLIAQIKAALEGKAAGGEAAPCTRVDYIQFTGKQTVDTGIVCTQDTKIRVVFSRDSNASQYMYGVVNSGNTASVTAYFASGGSWRFGNKSVARTIVADAELVQCAIISSSGIDSPTGTNAFTEVSNFETVGSLTIGSCRSASGSLGSPQFDGKIYVFEMWEGDTRVLSLIPDVDSDGEYRFRDSVSETFLYSTTDTPLEGGSL